MEIVLDMVLCVHDLYPVLQMYTMHMKWKQMDERETATRDKDESPHVTEPVPWLVETRAICS
jgi:hypothetical protein